MSLEALSVLTKIGADLSGLKTGIQEANKSLGDIGKGASTAGLDSLVDRISAKLDNVGKTATSAGVTLTATLTTSIVAAGAAALAVGEQFDDAFDKIRIGTGATGEELDKLQQSFRNVAADTPSSLGDISTALTALGQRTSATGEDLENLAKTELNLARITGGDLKTQIAATTRLFGDWSISVQNQTPALDTLLKVSQRTGVGVNELSQKLVQYGAPLRQLGFGFEQAAAIMGKFEKEGVNSELVLGSLRIALTKMAKEGIKDPATALEVLTQKIKDAGDSGKANAIALQIFGARAGPDMAAAIREGRFEVGALLDSIKNSSETVAKASGETADFAESFTILKNKVLLALEPLGAKLFQAVNNMMPLFEKAVGVIEQLATWFGNLSPAAQTVGLALGAIAAAIGPALVVFGQIASAIGTITSLFGGFGASAAVAGEAAAGAAAGTGIFATALEVLTGPIGIAIAAVTALVVAYTTNFAGIKDAVDGVVADLIPVLQKLWEGIKQIATTFAFVYEAVKPILSGLLSYIGNNFSAILDVIRAVLKALNGDWSGAWEMLKSAAAKQMQGLNDLLSGIFQGLLTLLKGIWNIILADIQTAWGGIKSFFTSTIPNLVIAIVTWFSELPAKIIAVLEALPGTLARLFGEGLRFVIDTTRSAIEAVVGFFATLPERLGAFAIAAWEFVKSAFAAGVQYSLEAGIRLYNGIGEWIGKVPELLKSIWDSVLNFLTNLPSLIWEKAKSIGASIWNGFREGLDIHSPSGPEKDTANMEKGLVNLLNKAGVGVSGPSKGVGKSIKDGFASGLAGMDAEVAKVVNLLATTPDKVEKAVLPGFKKVAKSVKEAFKEILDGVNDYIKSRGLDTFSDKQFLELEKSLRASLIRQSQIYKEFSDELKRVQAAAATSTHLIVSVTQADFDKFSDTVKKHLADVKAEIRILPPVLKEIPQGLVDMANASDKSAQEFADKVKTAFLKVYGSADEMQARLDKLGREAPKPFSEAAVTIIGSVQKIEDALKMDEGVQVAEAQLKIRSSIEGTISTFQKLGEQAGLTGTDLVKFVNEKMAQLPPAVRVQAQAVLKEWSDGINKLPGALDSTVNKLLDVWGKFDPNFRAKVKGSIGGIIEALENVPGAVGDKLKSITDKFLTWVDKINSVLHGLHQVFNQIPDGLQGLVDSISKIFKKSNQVVLDTVNSTQDQIQKAAKAASQSTGEIASSAEEGGGRISKAFGVAQAALGGFITGLSTAAATGSKAIGALVGGLQGALQGFAAGGPIGAVIGGIGGILGGLFGGGKSAAQKEKERLELERLKQDVQKGAQDVMQAAFDTMQKALETFEKLADFTKVPSGAIHKFFNQMHTVIELFISLAKVWNVSMIDAAKKFAESVGPVLEAIGAGVDAFEKLSFFTGVPDQAITLFGEALQRSVELFIAISDNFENSAVKHAKKFAVRAAEVVNTIGAGVDAFLKLNDYKGISSEIFDQFAADLDYAIERMIEISENISNKGLKWAAKFSDRAQSIVSLIKDGVDSLQGVNDYKALDASIFDSFLADIKLAVEKMQELVAAMDTQMLSLATAFSQKATAIFAAIKAGVEAFTALRDYKSIPAEIFAAVISDFKNAVKLLSETLDLALEGEKLATAFRDAAVLIAAALADAGKALGTLAAQAGQTVAAAAASSVGATTQPLVVVSANYGESSFAASAGAGTTNVFNGNINVTIEARDLDQYNSANEFVESLVGEFRTRIRRT